MANNVAQNTGVTSFSGNSWWHRFIGADPSKAEAAGKMLAQAMGN